MTPVEAESSHATCILTAWREDAEATETLAAAWTLTVWLYTGEEEVSFYLRQDDTKHRLHVRVTTTEKLQAVFDTINQSISTPKRPLEIVDGEPPLSLLCVGEAAQTRSNAARQNGLQNGLQITCKVSYGQLLVKLQDPEGVVPAWQCEGMLQQFIHLVGGLLQATKTDLVRQVITLSSTNSQKIEQWHGAESKSIDACIHDLILQQCRQRPHALAVDAWDGQISYEHLDQLSLYLAYRLIALNVSKGDIISVCTEKSCWFTVVILAVLRAGASFVALDAAQPVERLKTIVETVQSKIVLSSARYRAIASSLRDGVEVLEMGWDQQWTNGPPSQLSRLPLVESAEAAYIAFTSGSTGTPKGAVIEHKQFCTGALAHGPAYHIQSDSRVFQFSSYAFDGSIMDNLTTLLHGGCVCVPSEEERTSNLAGAITQLRANVLCTTPSILRTLQPEAVPTLQTVILTGELTAKEDIKTWADRVRLILTYGPTECSVSCSATTPLAPDSDPRLVGRPYASAAWLVHPNDDQLLTPLGAVGELCLEGPIVGREYLHQPEQTAAAFWQDPSWLPWRDGRRVVYRTGDLLRQLPDGSLYFLGRKDAQVKIRGQRVELGEIEHHLRQAWPRTTPSVVVAMVRLNPQDQSPMLTAFITESADGSTVSANSPSFLAPRLAFSTARDVALQDIRHSLPAYMIPSVIFPMNRLPLTPSGKADRRQLQRMVMELSDMEVRSYRATQQRKIHLDMPPACPQTEQIMSELANQILKRGPKPTVTREDDLLDFGLDSLMAMQLASRAREAGLHLTVANIFAHPTIAALADVATVKSDEQLSFEDIPTFSLVPRADRMIAKTFSQHQLSVADIEDIYPCTGLQAWLAHISATGIDNMTSIWETQLPTNVDIDRLADAWTRVSNIQSVLRTRIIQPVGGPPLQLVVRQPILVEILAPSSAPAITSDCNVWALGKPLLRVMLMNGDKPGQPSRCIVAIHHILHDGYSLPVLFRQVNAAYHGSSPKPQSFGVFIQYLSRSQGDVGLLTQSTFQGWSNQTAFPGIPHDGYRVLQDATLYHTIPLKSQGRSMKFTIPTILQLSLAIVIYAHTGTTDVGFQVVDSGRGVPIPGLHEIIGPTAGMRPVRINLEPERTVQQSLEKIHLHGLQTLPYPFCGLSGVENISPPPALNTVLSIDVDETKMYFSGIFERTQALKGEDILCDIPLGLLCHASSSSIRIRAQYDSRVISRETLGMMLKRLDTIFDKVCSDSGLAIGAVASVV